MKKIVRVLGIIFLFPVLYLFSCKSGNDQRSKENIPHVDTVIIQQMKFIPGELKVNKGDTVVWLNKGMVSHTIKSFQENKFYSDTLDPGKSWKQIITDSAGYFCTIHTTMNGKIMIK
jgi:plastocyanin